MTTEQLIAENQALRARIAQLEAAEAVQSAKLHHHVAHSGHKGVLRTAYQQHLVVCREEAMRTGRMVRV